MSGTTLSLISRFPEKIIKTAVELRRMGSDLNKAAEGAAKLLDFTTSIQDEMEASVLLGQSINLQKARMMGYNGDLIGQQKEILDIAKKIGFQDRDYFQKQSLAKAFGMGVDELTNLLVIDKQIRQVERSGTDNQKLMLKNYREIQASNKASADILGKSVEDQMMARSNAEYTTAISQKWQGILTKIQYIVYPILSALLSMVPPVLDMIIGANNILRSFQGTSKVVEKIGAGVSWFSSGIAKIIPTFLSVSKIITHIEGSFANLIIKVKPLFSWIGIIGSKLAGLFAPLSKAMPFLLALGKIGVFFGKWITPIGWVITGLQFIAAWANRFGEFVGTDGKIMAGLKAIGYALYDVLVKPFIDAYNWVASLWSGNSPSKLGMSIVNGITAIGPLLFSALTSPFVSAFSWISKLIPDLSTMGSKMGKIGSPSIETRIASTYVPAVTVSPTGTTIAGQPSNAPATTSKKAKDESIIMTEDTGIKILNMLGKIYEKDSHLYMDGQLMSATLARQTDFRKGYGVNVV